MRLRAEQIESALEKQLAAIYLISGDEPLQSGEVADCIRLAAKKNEFTTREILTVEKGFEWNELKIAAHSLSIFADKKLIDLRIPTGKPGIDGGKALKEYCQRLPENTLLLITTAKLEKSVLKTKWFQAIEHAGVVIQIWPLDGGDLIQWLQRRAQKRGLNIDPQGIKLLASRIEGNLLAASQEIEKLYILHGTTHISRQAVEEAVADSTRFDVFKLTDCVLAGRLNRAIKIINGLKAEGIAAPIVLWALARETRMLINMKTALQQGQNKENVFKQYRLWDKRKHLVNTVLSRLQLKDLQNILMLGAKADRQIKGQEKGDYWETLFSLCLLFCVPSGKI